MKTNAPILNLKLFFAKIVQDEWEKVFNFMLISTTKIYFSSKMHLERKKAQKLILQVKDVQLPKNVVLWP